MLAGTAAAVVVAAAGVASVATFRLHRSPRQGRFLDPGYLVDLRERMQAVRGPRILFVGNSMTLRHDIPARVAALAAAEGVALSAAMAASDGARLVESVRIEALRELLSDVGWDALVLQDFTKTPLRAWDRWGAAWAAARMALRAGRPPVLLFPPWPDAPGHPVYRSGGCLEAVPDGPDDFARRTMAFYERLAGAEGFHVAPVPPLWVETGPDRRLYGRDGHHASVAGAEFVARILWRSLSPLLP
jgi:hypothetical protein